MKKIYNPSLTASIVAILLINSAAAAEITKVNITSRTETYANASDILNAVVLNPVLFGTAVVPLIKVAAGAAEGIASGCIRADWWGVEFTSAPSSDPFTLNFGSTMQSIAGIAGDFGANGISVNGVVASFIPQVSACGPTEVQTKLGGTTSLYVAHTGTGPYTAKINSGNFRVSRDLMIYNPSSEVIELPVHISGSGTAAVSLGPDVTTYAYAKLRIHGNVAGQQIDEGIKADGALGFPDVRTINVTRRFVVAPAKSNTQVAYDVQGEFSIEVKAKGIGFFGLITQSATASVDFPNTLSIQNFTGQNGGPLPPNVVIFAPEENGAVLVDTTLRLEIIGVNGGNLELRINGPVGRTVQLEHSASLTGFRPLGSSFTLPSAASVRQIPLPSAGKGFLRLSCQ